MSQFILVMQEAYKRWLEQIGTHGSWMSVQMCNAPSFSEQKMLTSGRQSFYLLKS